MSAQNWREYVSDEAYAEINREIKAARTEERTALIEKIEGMINNRPGTADIYQFHRLDGYYNALNDILSKFLQENF